MAAVSVPPTEEAREVFRRLGYVVDGDGAEFVAERKWRRVRVTTLCADDAARPDDVVTTDGGDLRCFVTWKECAADLGDRLAELSLGGEWAIIGVDADGNHEVHAGAA